MRDKKKTVSKKGRKKRRRKVGAERGGSETNTSTKISLAIRTQNRQNTVIVRLFTARRTEQQAPGSGQTLVDGGAPGTDWHWTGATRCAHGNQPGSKPQPQPMAHGWIVGLFCLAGAGRRYSRRCATFRPAETFYRGQCLGCKTGQLKRIDDRYRALRTL